MGVEAFTVEGDLKLNTEGFESQIKSAESSTLSFMDVFKGNMLSNLATGAISKIGGAIASGLSKGVGAVKNFVSESVSAFSQFEQLSGGVETLFGNASRSAADYANDITTTVAEANEKLGEYAAKYGENFFDAWSGDMYAQKLSEVGKMTEKQRTEYLDELREEYDKYVDYVGMSEEQITAKAQKEYSDRAAAQELVMSNAKKAWQTAGLDMNSYMETVTGFSASLAQSLDNDQLKTAEYADRALRDMSDNANKMGTQMGSIMNAYMGFSKQNYTMLDNLKLGYGGTKSEMERLIKDASKMTAVQKDLNLTVEEGDTSFGNIVNAISVVQQKLAITGTTAEEAATTIEGSHKAMVAAWENVKIAFSTGEGLEDAFDNLMDAIFGTGLTEDGKETGYINQLLPRIEKVFDSIGKYLPQVVSKLSEYLPVLLDALKPVLEAIKNAIVSILNSEEFKESMRKIGETLIGALKDGLDAVGLGGLGDAIQWLWDNRKAIVEVGEILLAAFAGSKLINGVSTVASGIKNIGGALFGKGGEAAAEGVAGAAKGTGITGGSAFSAISAAAPWLVAIEGGREVISHGKELLGAANDWETTVNTANEAFKKGEISAGERAEAIVDQNEKIMDAVQGLYNAPIIGAAMGGNVNTFLNQMVDTAKAKNQELRDEAKSMAANFSDVQKNVIATITGVTGALDVGVDDMTETLHEGFGGMPSDVQALQEGISQTVNYGVDDVVSSLDRLREATAANFDSISGAADETESDLADFPTSVFTAITGASSALNIGVDDMVSTLQRLRVEASRAATSIYEITEATASSLAGVPDSEIRKMQAARHYASAVDSPVIFDHPEYAMVGDGTEPEILMGINTFRAMLEQAQSTIQAQVNVNPTSGGTTAQGQERQIIIPVYIGDEKIDEVVVDAVRRQTYLTGGR